MTRREPSDVQIEAVGNSTRIRILRLCTGHERTNKELADRLGLDPSTVLHHLRLLVDAGFLEPTDVRKGPSGAYEKPYRSTGLAWSLSFGVLDDEEAPGEPALLNAFRHELREAGPDAVVQLSRFHLHLDDAQLAEFTCRIQSIVDEYVATDAGRQADGHPGYGALFVMHRLARDPQPAT